MSNSDWTDRIVGARMKVDQEFSERVQASEFSSQEWGMIMTAVELEIENPEDPENARVVANTDNVPQVMPALDDVRSQMGAMGGAPSGSSESGGGIVSALKGLFGMDGGGGGDQERLDAAEALADEYAERLQSHLESKHQWETACSAAARGAE
ncbi:DUF5799 family protein [Natronoarchaeum sp. GCM10025321]|uniref:DUF5799 family protein n=1 Tax=Natronoarchaeum sp. GCM10025321 TaxID=3252684 RepID=UPI0036214FEE